MDMNKYNEWPANHKHDANPSPKIIALGKKIKLAKFFLKCHFRHQTVYELFHLCVIVCR